MASSFKGWGQTWLDSWGPVNGDPNAMVGHAAFTFTAALQVNSGEMQGTASFRIDAAGFVPPVITEAPKYYAGPSEKEKALMRQRLEEDEVLLAIIQMFVMEEA